MFRIKSVSRLCAATVAAAFAVVAPAAAATLITNGTPGLYNEGIGTALNGTSVFFPDSGTADDPTTSLAVAPDLSAASAALGSWLTSPAAPGGSWSASPVAIPTSWAVETETAIIYEIDAGLNGLTNVIANFGVDNGILVWLDGVFIGGDQAPGGAAPNEYSYALGTLSAGTHYLQVLREDHGGATGYVVDVSGDEIIGAVPLPASSLLLLSGLAGAIALRRRRR